MPELNNANTTSSTEDILSCLNLRSIVGTKAKTLLQCITCAYFEEKVAGKNPKYPRILLLGRATKTHAYAIHNSLGNVNFVELSADFVSQGCDNIVDILRNCSEFDTIYISDSSQMSAYVQNFLWRYLKFGEVEIVEFFEREKKVVKLPDTCLILGTTTLQQLSRSLYKKFVHVHMPDLTKYQLVEVLKMNCEWYGIEYTSEQVLEKIAEEASGRAGKAVRLLELARKFMIVAGKEKISLLHVNQVLTNYCFPSSSDS